MALGYNLKFIRNLPCLKTTNENIGFVLLLTGNFCHYLTVKIKCNEIVLCDKL